MGKVKPFMHRCEPDVNHIHHFQLSRFCMDVNLDVNLQEPTLRLPCCDVTVMPGAHYREASMRLAT